MKIYLIGANGKLGSIICSKIEVIPLVRKSSGLRNEIISDFTETSLKKILSDADVIINAAGLVHGDKNSLIESNVELVRKIVLSAPEKAKIIQISSISVYGKKLTTIVDESTPPSPDSIYSQTKLEAEKIVQTHKIHIILRVGTIYGEGFSDYYKILNSIEKGKMKLIGNGENHIPFVYVGDVVQAIIGSFENGSGTYVICGPQLTQKRIFELAATELGVKSSFGKIPIFLAKIMLKLKTLFSKKSNTELTMEHLMILYSDRKFDISKAKKELNFDPIDLEKGIKLMVKNYLKMK